jgi:hypothetical protein
LSSEQTIDQEKKSRKTKKSDKTYTNKEKKKKNKEGKEEEEQQQSQIKKLPTPIIYDPDINRSKIILTYDNNNSFKQYEEQTNRDAIDITNYYLELHKNMINSYNYVYSQILPNISNLSYSDFTVPKRFTNYSFDIKAMYTSLISNRDKSLTLIDNIITNNLDTFIKSIKLTQKFYKDVIESYLNCIKK